MPPSLTKKLRFSDVVYAIDTTPKSLRLWLQRDLVQLHTERPEAGGWLEYSYLDIGILAMVRQLTNVGVDVLNASRFARWAVIEVFPVLNRAQNPDDMPVGVLHAVWAGHRVQVFDRGQGWEAEVATLYKSEHSTGDLILPSDVVALRREFEPAPVFITIDVATVLQTAFDRATESLNEGNV